jgi:hypothetical protein
MIVKCLFTSYQQIPALIYEYGFISGSELHLTAEKQYAVYGILYGGFQMNGSNAIQYLIIDDLQYPAFFAARLFEVECPHLYGDGWSFNHQFGNDFLIDSILGYEKLATDPQYFDDFVLRNNREDYEIFEQWKMSIDKAMSQATCPCNVILKPVEIKKPAITIKETEKFRHENHYMIAKFLTDDIDQLHTQNINVYSELHKLLQKKLDELDKRFDKLGLVNYFYDKTRENWIDLLERHEGLFIKIFEIIIVSIQDLKKNYPQEANKLLDMFLSKTE